jgi:uncharacterized membrane protein
MRSLIYAIATGLAGAAVLHILIILSVPHFTGRDAYTRITAYDEDNRFFLLDARKNAFGLSTDDPFLEEAVCSFSVEDRPVRLTAEGGVPFWSYAVYDSSSNEVFSMNDRSSVGGALDTIVASPAQLNAIRKDNPDIVARSILVEMPRPEGYVVLRALAPAPSFREAARDFLAGAACEPL